MQTVMPGTRLCERNCSASWPMAARSAGLGPNSIEEPLCALARVPTVTAKATALVTQSRRLKRITHNSLEHELNGNLASDDRIFDDAGRHHGPTSRARQLR